MLRSGQILTGTIAYLDESSNGILMAGKDKVFVRHVLAKEKVKVKIQKRLKEGYSANVIEILQKDKERIKPVCGIYERCGSCHLMHMSAQGQKHQPDVRRIHREFHRFYRKELPSLNLRLPMQQTLLLFVYEADSREHQTMSD